MSHTFSNKVLLGHKTVSGELHKQIKRMVKTGIIEPTIPDKPTSASRNTGSLPKGGAGP